MNIMREYEKMFFAGKKLPESSKRIEQVYLTEMLNPAKKGGWPNFATASNFGAGIDPNEIESLVDAIESKFNLSITNPSSDKYRKVNMVQLVEFILDFKDENIKDTTTANFIASVAQNQKTVDGILRSLYMMLK